MKQLRDLLEISDSPKKDRSSSSVVVVEIKGKKLGLIVDELIGIEQIFVKPLGKLLNKVEGLYGTTILGDGRILLVLDLERLG